MKPSPSADPTLQPCNHVPLTAKELSGVFHVGQDYIYAMRDAGAPFWGKVSTVAALMEWWQANPQFSRRSARKGKATGTVIAVSLPLLSPVPIPRKVARNGGILVL